MDDRKDWPDWLRNATVENAKVTIENGSVVWHDGVWHDGEWCGGVWNGGEWHDGVWHDGEWCGGVWNGGEWRGGVWHDGEWCGGVWHGGGWRGGVWHGGVWRGGVWHDGAWRDGEWCGGEWNGGEWCGLEDRLLYHASLCGIIRKGDMLYGYRTTCKGGMGRFNNCFTQREGEYYEEDALPSGSGVCVKGIHVTGAAKAWAYFGVDTECQFWLVEFKVSDLLDCDGEKARIKGGVFTKVDRPF